ncbi:MAG: 23S rRNA (adenine(2503)-C(2))-methyltransferase RlmN, partial [Verrucomicrobia bacterium]|nr:23S rRNA (adenine(2503)-C(2))-methyltransferase RlmN [Verrucomicrobiota bacterium]
MTPVYNSALESLCRDSHRLRLFRNAFFKKALPVEECLEKAPELAGKVLFQCLELVGRYDSQLDGATKLVFQCLDGARIEAVILRIAS